jgi:hypothetical protein
MLKWAITRDYHKRWNDQYTTDEYIRLTIGGKKYRKNARTLQITLGAAIVAMPFVVYVVMGG